MNKESFYFSHDYNSRSDHKIKKLLLKHGMLGYGIYWSIIEDLYLNANAMPMQCDVIAFELRCSEDIINSIINDFDLFKITDGFFTCPSIERRLHERVEKSEKARQSALSRWDKNATAMRPQCDRNAIKERKGKEINKSVEIRETVFTSEVWQYKEQYSEIMLKAFINYWTEKNKSRSRMRFETEKTFEISKRLSTWASRDNKFSPKKEDPAILSYDKPIASDAIKLLSNE